MDLRLIISSFEDEALILDYLGSPDIISKVYRSEREIGVLVSERTEDAVMLAWPVERVTSQGKCATHGSQGNKEVKSLLKPVEAQA